MCADSVLTMADIDCLTVYGVRQFVDSNLSTIDDQDLRRLKLMCDGHLICMGSDLICKLEAYEEVCDKFGVDTKDVSFKYQGINFRFNLELTDRIIELDDFSIYLD